MNVIAGYLGGRSITTPRGNRTKPMAERVRGALFNKLEVTGKSVLDPYAGSAALSVEALSRGASSALAIESDKQAQRAIENNIEALNIAEKLTLVSANCLSWSKLNVDKRFDILLLDPPYDSFNLDSIQTLSRHLSTNGIMVLSYPGRREAVPNVDGVVVVDARSYGDAALAFYRNEN